MLRGGHGEAGRKVGAGQFLAHAAEERDGVSGVGVETREGEASFGGGAEEAEGEEDTTAGVFGDVPSGRPVHFPADGRRRGEQIVVAGLDERLDEALVPGDRDPGRDDAKTPR